jgi:hypothetical protein
LFVDRLRGPAFPKPLLQIQRSGQITPDQKSESQLRRKTLPALEIESYPELAREFGGANRNRTDDLLNAIQALSQLSYGPTTGMTGAVSGF